MLYFQSRKYVPITSSPVTTVPVSHAIRSAMVLMTVVTEVTNKQTVVNSYSELIMIIVFLAAIRSYLPFLNNELKITTTASLSYVKK